MTLVYRLKFPVMTPRTGALSTDYQKISVKRLNITLGYATIVYGACNTGLIVYLNAFPLVWTSCDGR